jgi:hypothetical protein
VVHFAVENPHGKVSIFIDRRWEILYDNDGSEIAGGYKHHNEMLPIPDIASVWRLLAGRAGEFLHDGSGRCLRRDPDHYKAALALFPWMSREKLGSDFLRGRIGEALRLERRNVEQLLRENWRVVKRVAEGSRSHSSQGGLAL